ncbi:amidohydrolase family protein [Chrysiogenes arsenatis]|uniref:amidohydrolase family protein n=1 Tax=Chrysiogenes arsenatis TaxID=309797 RepID=UPI0004289FC3|nr:amidohydrolase family protein [Chrysiogenes arsenatis]
MSLADFPLFDSHLHIIDSRFPLIPNEGYLPNPFPCEAYLSQMQAYTLVGGAVVSGSFQGFDQHYLIDTLRTLGQNFVGVTQLPATVSDATLQELDCAGIRAIRFNLKRGGSAEIQDLDRLARRAHEVVGWHAELYIDSRELEALYPVLISLPAVSIDHLGLSLAGFPTLLRLAEKGVHVKATGFGRVDFDIATALRTLCHANPDALMFGSDLPSTRAPRPYQHSDFTLIFETLGETNAQKVLLTNALEFYRQVAA